MFKKLTVALVVISILCCFTGCGCKHIFKDATCTEPQTCEKCGETQGEVFGHKWQEATCTQAKKCEVCGETEGEPIGHDYNGKKCINCGIKDPSYIDPNNIGFKVNYELSVPTNVWVQIDAYDFSNNKVNLYQYVRDNNIRVRIYNDNYWQEGYILKSKLISEKYITSSMLENIVTEPYNLLSNDAISYNGKTGWGAVAITQRVISSDEKKIVIKTTDETGFSDSEDWFVPINFLDFNTLSGSGEDCFVSYKK